MSRALGKWKTLARKMDSYKGTAYVSLYGPLPVSLYVSSGISQGQAEGTAARNLAQNMDSVFVKFCMSVGRCLKCPCSVRVSQYVSHMLCVCPYVFLHVFLVVLLYLIACDFMCPYMGPHTRPYICLDICHFMCPHMVC